MTINLKPLSLGMSHDHHHHRPHHSPSLHGYVGGGHAHGDGESHERENLFKQAYTKVKSVDGIDETATLLGQTLPGLAGPIAALSVLTLATPLVWMGVLGMKHEYAEAREEYDHVLQSSLSTEEKLRQLAEKNAQYRSLIERKIGLPPARPVYMGNRKKPVKHGHKELPLSERDEMTLELTELEILRNKELIHRLGEKYGWTGLLGMCGMFAGMVASAGANAVDIAMTATATTAALETAATVLEGVSGGTFLVGQAAMTVYAGVRLRQGKIARDALLHQQELFAKHSTGISPASKTQVDEILRASIRYIQKHSMEYGGLTIAGQAFMIGGTIAGLTGAGLVATVPLYAVGAPLTIGAAISRIVYQGKETSFQGAADSSKYARTYLQDYDLLTLFGKEFEEHQGQSDATKTILEVLDPALQEASERLAELKSLSLIRHMTNDRLYRNRTVDQKWDKVQARLQPVTVRNRQLKAMHRSELENTVAGKVSQFLADHEDTVREHLDLSPRDANMVLLENLVRCLGLRKRDDVVIAQGILPDGTLLPANPPQEKPQRYASNSTLSPQQLNAQTLEVMKNLGLKKHYLYKEVEEKGLNRLSDKDLAELTKKTTTLGKTALKHTRFQLAGDMVRVTHIREMQQQLEKQATSKSVSVTDDEWWKTRNGLSEPLQPQVVPPQPVYFQDIQLLLEKEPATLSAPLRQEVPAVMPFSRDTRPVYSTRPKPAPAASEIQQLAKAMHESDGVPPGYVTFTEVHRHTDPKTGIEHITYQDPYDASPDKQIHYIRTPDGKLTVEHGRRANALVPVHKHTEGRVTGLEIHSITHGRNIGHTNPLASVGSGVSQLQAISLRRGMERHLLQTGTVFPAVQSWQNRHRQAEVLAR